MRVINKCLMPLFYADWLTANFRIQCFQKETLNSEAGVMLGCSNSSSMYNTDEKFQTFIVTWWGVRIWKHTNCSPSLSLCKTFLPNNFPSAAYWRATGSKPVVYIHLFPSYNFGFQYKHDSVRISVCAVFLLLCAVFPSRNKLVVQISRSSFKICQL